jgi:hypothetical protein
MKVIKDFITRGVTTLPLKRNLIPRFTKEEAQETMKDALTVERILEPLKGGNFSISYAIFPSVSG